MNQSKPGGSEMVAVGYCRCSTDEQGSTSIPQQKEEIGKWAAVNGYKIVEWFVDEGRTGTNFVQRPGFANLVKRVEEGPDFAYVLVYDESRWGRALNPRENAYWKIHFERFNVRVRIIHSNSRNGDDIGSYVVEVVESAEASEYSKKLSRAIRRGMLSSQQGIYSRGGSAPYGYKRVAIDLRTGEKRELRDGMRSVPKQEKVVWELASEAEVSTVRRIFEMRAMGMGFVGIADTLNQEGTTCPKLGRWRNLDNKWTGVTILGILQNPAYKGDRVYNRLSFSKILAKERGVEFDSKWFNEREEWIVVPEAHPAIITKDLFQQVAALRKSREPKQNQHFQRSQYLLTGIVKCVHCGYSFQGYHHTQTGRRYYVDGGYVNKGKSVCRSFSIQQAKLENFVLSSIREKLLVPEFIGQTREYVEQMNLEQPSLIEKRLASLTEVMRENTVKIENLLALAESGSVLKTVASRIRELEEIQDKLQEEKRRLSWAIPPKLDPDKVAEEVRIFLEEFEKGYEELTVEERKELLRRMVEVVLIDRVERKARCYIRRLPIIPNVTDRAQIPSEFQGGGGIPVGAFSENNPKTATWFQGAASSPNGIRTRILALRGPRPKPLDDRALTLKILE